jgi:xanthine dehydrogenase YagR molybdenum-binding subunit
VQNAFPHPITAGGRTQEPDESHGDLEVGLAAGAARVEEAYETPFETHNPLEPHATIAAWTGDRLTVYDSSQWVSEAGLARATK